MDIKLKDILGIIKTNQLIKLEDTEKKQCFFPSYDNITQYNDFYVENIKTNNNVLIIKIVKELIPF